jgi:hypothetical protein
MDAFLGFGAAGQPRVVFVDNGFVSGGDFTFPSDTRARLVRLGGMQSTPTPPPEVTITTARRQILRDEGVQLRP